MGERDIEVYIRSWKLIPAAGGKFEVTVNGDLVYSRLSTGRHAEPDEIRTAIIRKLEEVNGQG